MLTIYHALYSAVEDYLRDLENETKAVDSFGVVQTIISVRAVETIAAQTYFCELESLGRYFRFFEAAKVRGCHGMILITEPFVDALNRKVKGKRRILRMERVEGWTAGRALQNAPAHGNNAESVHPSPVEVDPAAFAAGSLFQ